MSSTTPHQRLLLLLLLLSRDLRSADRDLRFDRLDEPTESTAEQLALPGVEPPVSRKLRRRSRSTSSRPTVPPADDPLLKAFLRRLTAQGRARKGRKAYEYQIRSMLMVATRLIGRVMTCSDLIRDEDLLGR